jgi:hypothetical protein
MKKICAWCGKVLPCFQEHHFKGTSHGICRPCAEYYFDIPKQMPADKLMNKYIQKPVLQSAILRKM